MVLLFLCRISHPSVFLGCQDKTSTTYRITEIWSSQVLLCLVAKMHDSLLSEFEIVAVFNLL